jgi:phospholipid/cholesterol/gamma-HCH transport system substrate-binding protein
MEIRARYLLIGFFTLAVILGGFAFVYWLDTKGGIGERTPYLVRFENNVSGLQPGSAVLFNGLRVGEVTGVQLVPTSPQEVDALIGVVTGAPVKSDTRAALEFQGLTGVPVVSLSGGSAGAPPFTRSPAGIPVLTADPGASQTMTESARTVLQRLDKILGENEEPVKSMIANINTFADALARNSGKVDGILAGLERMTGGGAGKTPGLVYDLTALPPLQAKSGPLGKHVAVMEPTALLMIDNEKILSQPATGELAPLDNARWGDALPRLLQARVVQSFENAGYLGEVNRPIDTLTPDYQLLLEIRKFQIVEKPEPAASVQVTAKIVSNDGQLVASQIFTQLLHLDTIALPEAAKGLDRAFGMMVSELIPWTVAAVKSAPEKENAPEDHTQ